MRHHRHRAGDGLVGLIAAAIMGFLFLVLSLLSVLLTAAFWALVIYLVLWILEAVFGVELLTAVKGAIG